jgi:cysteinyl-tRNA synthetase
VPGEPPIVIHDTASGEPRPLVPSSDGSVGIYACGPTVYNRIHVGNARPFVVFSWLKRFLQSRGLEAKLVINVTDVNDKIYTAAVERGVSSAALAEEMTAHYVADTDALGLGRRSST